MIAEMRVAAVLVLLASVMLAQNDRTVTGSPNDWPDRDRYLALDVDSIPNFHPTQKLHSAKAMIAGVTNPFAVHEGLETLKRGGSAADAALTTALAQIALNAGAAMSYAGILTAVYYDANSGKVYSLNAGWNTPRNETEPLSIPRPGTASGRTALVPGFMAARASLRASLRRIRSSSTAMRQERALLSVLITPSAMLTDSSFMRVLPDPVTFCETTVISKPRRCVVKDGSGL
jgi:hypothetical protein